MRRAAVLAVEVPGGGAFDLAGAEPGAAGGQQRSQLAWADGGYAGKLVSWAKTSLRLLTPWSAAVKQTLRRQIDELVKARLTDSEAWRYDREHSRQALQHKLRAAQLAGYDIDALIDRITAAPMDRARSISSVLHGRLQKLALPDLRHDVTWAQRTPTSAPAAARELAARPG